MISDRRRVLTGLAALLATPGAAGSAFAQAMSRATAYAFSFPMPDGGSLRLSDFAGHPILVVNTASQCGFTPQFAGLQDLWARFHDKGLMVIGVPANDYGQEPGDAVSIGQTAHGQYGVGFPLTARIEIKGKNAHPFYKWAAAERPLELPRWNFHKYLIGRDGHIAKVFTTEIEPTDARVLSAIGKELAGA